MLNKRRAIIVGEEMREGTPFFTITALLPVTESIGFSSGMQDFSTRIKLHSYSEEGKWGCDTSACVQPLAGA